MAKTKTTTNVSPVKKSTKQSNQVKLDKKQQEVIEEIEKQQEVITEIKEESINEESKTSEVETTFYNEPINRIKEIQKQLKSGLSSKHRNQLKKELDDLTKTY